MSSSKLYWAAGVLVLLHLIPTILAWGQDGHYATCKIAEAYLAESAKAAVKELLPESAEGELAAVCSWPDMNYIRKGYPWSKELHFCDTPDFMCSYDYGRDCHNSADEKNRCVTGAVYNYTLQLVSAYHHFGAENTYNLTEALMFLSHFVGDIHQPLHVGFRGDLGGNKIKVRWYNKSANLHRVWDSSIIDTALDRFYSSNLTNLIEALKRNITDDWSNEIKFWQSCSNSVCPIQYASESVSLACKYAYKNATPGTHLDDDYFLSRLPIVEQRLAQGGTRLAAIVNGIFGSEVGIRKQTTYVVQTKTMNEEGLMSY